MRILIISNLFPPHYIGGYELACRDAVIGLRARGHDVCVLTSTYGVYKPQKDDGIYRLLDIELNWDKCSQARYYLKVLKKEKTNQNYFRNICGDFKPDLVYIWNPVSISLSIAFLAQQMNLPVCYFIFDHWLSRWQKDSYCHLTQWLVKRFGIFLSRLLLGSVGLKLFSKSLDLRYVQFGSKYLKQITLKVDRALHAAEVIYWGVDTNKYAYKESVPQPKRLLYVGQLAEQKGVHTAIEALKIIVSQWGLDSFTLSIIGGGIIPEYIDYLRSLAVSLGIEKKVFFKDFIPRELLFSVYDDHDILVFPSIWDEPFGITLLEAMSKGLAIVSTLTGGNSELLRDGENALVFLKEDHQGCAEKIILLFRDRSLFEMIRSNARQIVAEKYCLNVTIGNIEKSLNRILDNKR